MVPTNALELASALCSSELLNSKQLTQIATAVSQKSEPQELAFALVQKGLLTSFQAEQSLAGKTKELLIGSYQLLEPIGSGGMGLVYKAYQQRLRRTVAIKLIRPELVAKNTGAVNRFRREAMAVAQLSHPNIVVIYDADQAGDTYYLVMEYVDGPDLARLVNECGPLPVGLACEFMRQAALGLQHSFNAGFVHRDIKPSNLLVARHQSNRQSSIKENAQSAGAWSSNWLESVAHGVVKILDLGLARSESNGESNTSLTREGAMLGTPDYVAPEQARDASTADVRADIYSLGCTFYFVLAGHPPFPDGTVIEKLLRHQIEEPKPLEMLRPDVPPALTRIIRKMMAKDATERYQCPAEVADAITALLAEAEMHGIASAGSFAKPSSRLELNLMASTSKPIADTDADAAISVVKWPPDTAVAAQPKQTNYSANKDYAASVSIVTALSLQCPPVETTVPATSRIEARKFAVLRGHSGPVMALAFSPDCRLLATGGLDHCVRLWQMGQPPCEQATLQEPLLEDLQRLVFAPDGNALVAVSASLNARLFGWNWAKPLGQDRFAFEGSRSHSRAVAFSADGNTVAAATGDSVWLWTLTAGTFKKKSVLQTECADVHVVAFADNGRTIVTGHADGLIKFWKEGWLGSRAFVKFDGHRGHITNLCYSADGHLLASAAEDQTIQIWDGTGALTKKKACLIETSGIVRHMLFLPDPQYLLSVSDAGIAALWTWADGKHVCEWKLNQSIICSLALASDGGTVAAGNSDGSVSLFDLTPTDSQF